MVRESPRCWRRWRLDNAASPFTAISVIGHVGKKVRRPAGYAPHFFYPALEGSYPLQSRLDGAGSDTIVAEALGSRRFEVIVRGPGGHSWSDFGAPNRIVVLARAIQSFCANAGARFSKTTFNIGAIPR